MPAFSQVDERPVEAALRNILDLLDRQLSAVALLFPLVIATVLPAVFFTSWLLFDWTARRALVLAGGSCCGLFAMNLAWEILVTRWALRQFEKRFPAQAPERAVALQILSEMETPSHAEEKLRTMLASISPDRIIRHRRQATETHPETTLPTSLEQPGMPASAGARPGGYYDYIPLEPRPDSSLPPSSQIRT
ncbi:MAG: hypothetical protein U0840_31000 [Gemmataceae bacterium]